MVKLFFGWSNFKWLCREIMAMYSNSNSYFSKKRFESSVAFVSAISLILFHVWYTKNTITNSEVLADATLLFVIAGYTVNQIQKEKTIDTPLKKTSIPSKDLEEKPKEDFSKDENSI